MNMFVFLTLAMILLCQRSDAVLQICKVDSDPACASSCAPIFAEGLAHGLERSKEFGGSKCSPGGKCICLVEQEFKQENKDITLVFDKADAKHTPESCRALCSAWGTASTTSSKYADSVDTTSAVAKCMCLMYAGKDPNEGKA
jgi:hypothetical protein